MTIDTLAMTAICHELRSLIGAKVQDSVIASPMSIALELYANHRRHWLLLSAHPKWARIALHTTKIPRGVDNTTPLLLLLRKYVEDGRITDVQQLDLERIIVVSIAKAHESRNSDDDEAPVSLTTTTVKLIIEIMDQRSNIFLVDEHNMVLECVKRVPAHLSRRIALPQHTYQLPPVPTKADPRTPVDASTLEGLTQSGDLAKSLVSTFLGVSPQMARESVHRGDGVVQTSIVALQNLFTAPAEPCIIRNENGQPIGFAAYRLTHRHDSDPVESMQHAVITYYAAHEMLGDYQRRRDALRSRINEHRERLSRQLNHLQQEMTKAEALEQLRWEGQMIYAYIHSITPSMTQLEVDGAIIKLEPHVPPSQQAQARFKAYDKAKSAVEGLPDRIQHVSAELQGIDETLAFLSMADGFEAIESVARDAMQAGWLKANDVPKQARVRPMPPLRIVVDQATTIYVGRNAYQNQLVTFTIGEAQDTWLHARNMPGAHVIIKSGGRPVDDAVLQRAAQLAAHYSSGRTDSAVEIDICRRSAVRRIKGGPVGLVSYHAERTIRAQPSATHHSSVT
ncbi:MAG: fibronectin/fibrinogen-binding protein [Chloroflexi bacterium]|nr:fibronectin/fibrinogen-binding protein [Chloroflexota bacterium]